MKEQYNLKDILAIKRHNKIEREDFKSSEGTWDYSDSSLFVIGSSFSKTLPKKYIENLSNNMPNSIEEYGKAFQLYIEDVLAHKKDKTAIEFGGPGSQLFSDFSPGFFKKTVGVCLADVRNSIGKEKDVKNNHVIVEGDIMDTQNKKTYDEIFYNLGTKKVDLIVSRMMGPLNEMLKIPVMLDKIVRKWYSMLEKNGIIFAQFEFFPEHRKEIEHRKRAEEVSPYKKETEEYAKKWARVLEQKFPNQIEIQLGRGVIRLVKKDGAPDELPPGKELLNE